MRNFLTRTLAQRFSKKPKLKILAIWRTNFVLHSVVQFAHYGAETLYSSPYLRLRNTAHKSLVYGAQNGARNA